MPTKDTLSLVPDSMLDSKPDSKMVQTAAQTRGQLERKLSQSIQALYKAKLGHQPSKITCSLLDQKLIIVMENSITQPEQVLASEANEDLVQQVRSEIDAAIEPDVKDLIRQATGIEVLDLLSDTTVETGRVGIIAILASEPEVTKSRSSST